MYNFTNDENNILFHKGLPICKMGEIQKLDKWVRENIPKNGKPRLFIDADNNIYCDSYYA